MIRDAGDVVDRYSIAELKVRRLGTPESHAERAMFRAGVEELVLAHPHLNWANMVLDMIYINGRIWDLESAVRAGELDGDLTEVGRRAIAIRKVNAERVAMKNMINMFLGQGVQDVKQDHTSTGVGGNCITIEEFRTRYVLQGRGGACK